jgi:hypothetical protein
MLCFGEPAAGPCSLVQRWYKEEYFCPDCGQCQRDGSICIAKRSAPGIASRDPFETRCCVGLPDPDPAFTTTWTFLHVLSRIRMLDLTWRHYVEIMFPCTFTFNISHRIALRGLQRCCARHIRLANTSMGDLARGVVCALRSFVQRYGSFHTVTAAPSKVLYFTSRGWGVRLNRLAPY